MQFAQSMSCRSEMIWDLGRILLNSKAANCQGAPTHLNACWAFESWRPWKIQMACVLEDPEHPLPLPFWFEKPHCNITMELITASTRDALWCVKKLAMPFIALFVPFILPFEPFEPFGAFEPFELPFKAMLLLLLPLPFFSYPWVRRAEKGWTAAEPCSVLEVLANRTTHWDPPTVSTWVKKRHVFGLLKVRINQSLQTIYRDL